MPLTRSQLAAMLADNIGLTKVEARDLVASFYEELTLALETGESVFLAGFGEFQVTEGRVSFFSGPEGLDAQLWVS